jgi:hypothetical protein
MALGRFILALGLLGTACTKAEERASQTAPVEPEPKPVKPSAPPPPTSIELEALALRCEGETIARALEGLDRAALEGLGAGEGASTRLLARWQLERAFTAQGALTSSSVDAFVDAVEAELGMRPPAWWVEQLGSGRRSSDAGPLAYDVGRTGAGDRRGPWVPGPGSTTVRPNVAALLGAANDRLFFDLSMGRVELGPLPEKGAIEITRARAGTTLYWATFERGTGGVRFPLRAIGSDGRERWQAEVCGPDRQILGGVGHLTVEIAVLAPAPDPASAGMKLPAGDPTGIAVFTAESHGVALDVFDPGTGERTMAWSSDLWFAR